MKALLIALPLSLLLATAIPARAGVHADDLSRCLVASAGAEEQRLLVKWIFASMSLHADVAQYVSIPADQREALDKDTAALFTRLVTDACRKESHDAVKYEGATAMGAAFQLLGQVASQGIFSDPAVAAGMQRMLSHLDEAALGEALGVGSQDPDSSSESP